MTTLGAFGESWAVGYLVRLGYRIMARNVRYRVGEIDIVAEDDGELVFVEVKTRRSSAFGSPEESLSPRRYGRLAAAVQEYLMRANLEPDSYRIDVLAVEVDRAGRVKDARLTRNAEPPTG